jgi:hypothetical protein
MVDSDTSEFNFWVGWIEDEDCGGEEEDSGGEFRVIICYC